jgi:isopentenyl phosphate kinase
MKELIFIKLGGSVITDKDTADTADLIRIKAISEEIAAAIKDRPDLALVIGHGSGSFGHHAAHKFGTREGISTSSDWQGFTEVALKARELNQIVVDQLQAAGINAISFSPFSGIRAENRIIQSWDVSNLETCLQKSLIPVIYGDVILDNQLGGTILSTEELFSWLALKLQPSSVLLAGLEEGVWADFPTCDKLLSEICPRDFSAKDSTLQASKSTDVTGGMRSKVQAMIELVELLPTLQVQIFSGKDPGNVYSALMGNQEGTWIRNPKG